MPEPSWPPMVGNMVGSPSDRITSLGADMSPLRMWSSEWHKPAAAICTRTSPARGGSSSNSSTDQGPPTSCRIAARLFMRRART
ncbi:hypothetical protein AFC81_07015 [Mycobacterium avium subsp. paratuberculosis]|nr:hypothetical protein RC58_07240 [Mycobacterium avium subsp. paratuberculosis]AJK79002.1 hypothetical protein RE97_07240 [Mycobacterium avium subsp. paratuberculosis]ANH29038.1 hypothetical protein A0V42_12065 [Mycobacterium avium subsp. paratuberculosis]OHW71062.1 hypothetical protein AFC81_07015 [Mycobacterium avium subsp. paratuberculosis]OHW72639.1 hypothetical protein AFC82_08000 [Mycobacterium avium subsp. paratuberculosis]